MSIVGCGFDINLGDNASFSSKLKFCLKLWIPIWGVSIAASIVSLLYSGSLDRTKYQLCGLQDYFPETVADYCDKGYIDPIFNFCICSACAIVTVLASCYLVSRPNYPIKSFFAFGLHGIECDDKEKKGQYTFFVDKDTGDIIAAMNPAYFDPQYQNFPSLYAYASDPSNSLAGKSETIEKFREISSSYSCTHSR